MMRFFMTQALFALAIVCFTLPALAQTPISREAANNFYAACRSNQHPLMKAESLEAMCACNAAMMMENMTVEEVQTMKEQSQAGRNMLNKMLLEVYTPCMNYPVYDLVEGECLNNRNLDMAGAAMPKEQICACTARETASWFAEEGRAVMRTILEEQPNIYDPIEPLMNSKAFKTQSYQSMTACLTGGN